MDGGWIISFVVGLWVRIRDEIDLVVCMLLYSRVVKYVLVR